MSGRRSTIAATMESGSLDPELVRRSIDQRVVLRDVTWADYEALLTMRGERAVPRMVFVEGTLELMTPSRQHEIIKTTLARLLEAYAEELGIELEGYGSWTLKREDLERGLEADECYSVGSPARDVPDLAIEVVWTGGGLDKIDTYRRLGVREVWLWKSGRIDILTLRGDRYEATTHSGVLPSVDVALILEMVDRPTQSAAVRELRERVRVARRP